MTDVKGTEADGPKKRRDAARRREGRLMQRQRI